MKACTFCDMLSRGMDKKRRKFLKILAIGSGTLLMGEVLSPLLSKLLDNSSTKAKDKPSPKAFRVVENETILSVYDNSGEEIFQIDRGQ